MRLHWRRVAVWTGVLAASGTACAMLFLMFMFAITYANLPPIDSLADYRPKIPLRIWSSDGVLLGEFGEERLIQIVRENRHLPLARITELVVAAVEDWIGDNEQPDDVTLVLARRTD